ncbi:MAG: DNA adenine methylase [Planctomycetes bacterium]|nr:DNA adenine methylase [Planctomycetota bacterium]
MRLIGNKTKLLGQIEGFLAERRVRSGTFLDVFAGTASVGQHFRRLGFTVHTNDLLAASYVRQRATVALGRCPRLSAVVKTPEVRAFCASAPGEAALARTPAPDGASADLRRVVAYLNAGLRPRPGFMSEHYAEGGRGERLFFSRANGAKLDAVHDQLCAWRAGGALGDDGFYLLLSALLDAADRVANISGTYGAFLKALQRSAREPLTLKVPELEPGLPQGVAHRADANELVRELRVDVAYMDPPYNQRQYVKNYHVLEVLAELHEVTDRAAYAEGIYGKTGLRAFPQRLSAYCRKGRGVCREAFRDLVHSAQAEHLVISYSEEGILSREDIGSALAEACGQRSYDYARNHTTIDYKRFRSDGDAARSYRVLDGRKRDQVHEWLFYARKPRRMLRKAG